MIQRTGLPRAVEAFRCGVQIARAICALGFVGGTPAFALNKLLISLKFRCPADEFPL